MALTKREQLAVAGYAAPRLRAAQTRRPIKVVDKDGNVVRTTDQVELTKKILERVGIEFDVVEGRPGMVVGECGHPFRAGKYERISKWCPRCRDVRCSVCGVPVSKTTALRSLRTGTPACCAKHHFEKRLPTSVKCPYPGCGVTVTDLSKSQQQRAGRGKKVFCVRHKGGRDQKAYERVPCKVCGKPTSYTWRDLQRRGGTEAGCKEHEKGGAKKSASVKCSVAECPEMLMGRAANNARWCKPYCIKHKRKSPTKNPKHSRAKHKQSSDVST